MEVRAVQMLRVACYAAFLAAPLGCGDDGGSTASSRSGQCTLQVGGFGMPIDMGLPTYGFDFAAEEAVTGRVGEPAGDI